MSTGAKFGHYILQTQNSKNSEDSMGVEPPNPPVWVRQCLNKPQISLLRNLLCKIFYLHLFLPLPHFFPLWSCYIGLHLFYPYCNVGHCNRWCHNWGEKILIILNANLYHSSASFIWFIDTLVVDNFFVSLYILVVIYLSFSFGEDSQIETAAKRTEAPATSSLH